MFLMGVDLGQAQDYTALCVVQRVPVAVPGPRPRTEHHYHLRYLERVALGTTYPAIVTRVLTLLGTAPLSWQGTPLVVDRTGVGRAVVDLFTAAGVRPRAVTITGGSSVVQASPYEASVPKRDLVGTLVALHQSSRLPVAAGLALYPTLVTELVNFKMTIALETGRDSYEAWRESIHDDLVLAVALACWWGEQASGRPWRSGAAGGRVGESVVQAYVREVQTLGTPGGASGGFVPDSAYPPSADLLEARRQAALRRQGGQ